MKDLDEKNDKETMVLCIIYFLRKKKNVPLMRRIYLLSTLSSFNI